MSHKVIPFGNRILVKRRKIGEKLGREGLLVASAETSERPTDLADVIHVPELSLADKRLLDCADDIASTLSNKAANGDSEALRALMEFNRFLQVKSVQVGDSIMMGKYVGTDFEEKETGQLLTLVAGEDIIGLVVDEEAQVEKELAHV